MDARKFGYDVAYSHPFTPTFKPMSNDTLLLAQIDNVSFIAIRMKMNWQLSTSGIRWEISHDHLPVYDERLRLDKGPMKALSMHDQWNSVQARCTFIGFLCTIIVQARCMMAKFDLFCYGCLHPHRALSEQQFFTRFHGAAQAMPLHGLECRMGLGKEKQNGGHAWENPFNIWVVFVLFCSQKSLYRKKVDKFQRQEIMWSTRKFLTAIL